MTRTLLTTMERVHTEPGAEGKMLDVECNIEGKALALWPEIVCSLNNRRIGVSRVAWDG
jgi:hypothetical protein